MSLHTFTILRNVPCHYSLLVLQAASVRVGRTDEQLSGPPVQCHVPLRLWVPRCVGSTGHHTVNWPMLPDADRCPSSSSGRVASRAGRNRKNRDGQRPSQGEANNQTDGEIPGQGEVIDRVLCNTNKQTKTVKVLSKMRLISSQYVYDLAKARL